MKTKAQVSYPQLLHYRRTVSDMYAAARNSELSPNQTWQQWRQTRDQLFGSHPQSALDAQQLRQFSGLRYFSYNSAWRFETHLDMDVEPGIIPIETDVDGTIRAQRIGKVHFEMMGQPISLSLFWLLGYGGGVFLPFRDATNGSETYGGGRYLLDTIKHADLGQTADGKLILDFNYAYNPSCAYNHQWSCPLAPPENWLEISVDVGEKQLT